MKFDQSFDVIVCNISHFILAQQGWNILQSALRLFIVCLFFEQDHRSSNQEENNFP